MTDQTSGEPWRKFRMDDKLWDEFGALVGERKRSAVIRSLIQWQLANPTSDLSAVPTEQVLDFLVRVRVSPGDGEPKRRAEITELPGTTGPQVERLKAEIRQAIADHFNPGQSSSTKRPRKADQ